VFSIYLFALVLGGGLLAFSLFGGHDGGADAVADSHSPWEFLSVRTLTYFLFVFGGVGAVLNRFGSPLLVSLLAAMASGIVVSALVSATFGYLRRTDSGGLDGEDSFVGLTGTLTLPISTGGLGKVLVQRGSRSYELLARPLESAGGDPSSWKSVLVIEMTRGTAVVAPLEETALLESSPPSIMQE
jgi:hypothetical protein